MIGNDGKQPVPASAPFCVLKVYWKEYVLQYHTLCISSRKRYPLHLQSYVRLGELHLRVCVASPLSRVRTWSRHTHHLLLPGCRGWFALCAFGRGADKWRVRRMGEDIRLDSSLDRGHPTHEAGSGPAGHAVHHVCLLAARAMAERPLCRLTCST